MIGVLRVPRYAGAGLDRASQQRKDPQWLSRRLSDPGSMVVPLWRNLSLVSGLGDPEPRLICCSGVGAVALLAAAAETSFLGLDGERALFAADLSALSRDEAQLLAGGGEFVELRRAGTVLPAAQAALAAYARGMLYWHRHNRFCGSCGQASESRHGGHMRRCCNPDCGLETYPRTDPAVIVLVEQAATAGHPARCLLGRNRRFAPGVYSTLAGFVDPGENLEEAVAREILEEVGVRVGSIAYQASQPWPFPSSVMLGFRARALTSEISVDGDEIEEAFWFSAAQVRGFGDWNDAGARLRLPRRDSIAWMLISAWLAENA